MNDLAARAMSLFDDYVELPASERERRLLELAAREPALHDALRALLDADAQANDHLLDRSPADLLADKHRDTAQTAAEQDERADARIGSRLGPWRIDRVIGHGGMGTVYEAHRDDGEYQQRVALKCIRTELATPQLQAAFRDERNLLARLDHAGIAALVDGGVGEDGQPWFAMRFVDGIALDAWCDHRRASVRERVGLLIQVCEALAYAHAQGIVHRDIKPSNLLVSDDGRVQLVDFGISSHFAAQGVTPREQIAITPDYAAPEAREYGAHGPATDLYALGVLTYRLLCAQWPAPLHSLRNLIPIAASGEPVPMDRLLDDRDGDADAADDSADFIARQRGAADASALRRQLTGDLSAIALKAVATRPQDRYSSASEFASDLRRWREHRPVSVNPGSRWSRARKWQRRNPGAVAIGAGLLLVVGLGLSVTLWQQRRAQREAAATATVSQLFASTLGTATLSGLSTTTFSSKALLEKTERELRKLPLHDQPRLLARGLATLARSYTLVGDYPHANRLIDEAQRVLDRAGESDAFVTSARVSILNLSNRYREAGALVAKQLQALGDRDDEPTRLTRIAYTTELARAQWGMGRTEEATRTANALVEQTRALGSEHQEIVAQVLMLRAGFLNRLLRSEQAEADTRRAIALVRTSNPILADDGLVALINLVSRRGSPEVLPLAQELLRNRRNTLGESHPKTAQAKLRLALARYPSISNDDVSKALAVLKASYGSDNPAYAMALSAGAWAAAPDPTERIVLLRQALATLQRTMGPHAEPTMTAQFILGKELMYLPEDARTAADFAEGVALVRQAVDGRSRSGIPSVLERNDLIGGLLAHGDARQLALVQTLVDNNRGDALRYYSPDDYQVKYLEYAADWLLYRQGHYAQADRNFARRIEASSEFMRTAHPGQSSFELLRSSLLSQSLLFRALYAYQQCDNAQTEFFLQQAVSFSRRALGAESPAAKSATANLEQLRRHGRMIDSAGSTGLPPEELERFNRQVQQACRSHRSR
ncbi:serine/threonine protein kinase [Lysobacter capsici]|uniref:serine/threonine protein kinase n=1 Tax=Lysobacter capsici TaxID=435897 RepID=UPI00287BC447|nr:serine/threonine-protein kinase [Lysobacter capsici]WND82520.1 serine/threonine-protein kinase [Lysobacter capsici]WND87716.1 serine/threonine-protein kinase [Lysobacter capsici]